MTVEQDTFLDQWAISRLLRDWGLWRDTGRWEELRASYTPQARMKTTWFDGNARDFVDASATLASTKGALVQHFIGPSTIQVCGPRAVAETRVMLLVRDAIGGIPVDIVCYGRFVDRLVKRQGAWLIDARTPIYEKDSLVPVHPGQLPVLDLQALARYPEGYRHLAYLQALGGATIVTDIPAHNSAQQRVLYAEASQWLQGHIA